MPEVSDRHKYDFEGGVERQLKVTANDTRILVAYFVDFLNYVAPDGCISHGCSRGQHR